MIEVNDVSFTYVGAAKPAIKNLNFKVERGEIFGFLGPSGAGKSTTQKILTGLLQGYQGHVSVLGKEVKNWRSDIYERIGVSFEVPNHYLKLTAIENLTYFGSLYSGQTQEPQALLELVNLGEDGDLFVSQFSKGMKTRLSVARAILHNPELVFMDEPTVGLDPVNARRIKDLIKVQQDRGKTIFLTTHDMNVANELCDRVAFIIDGEIKLIDVPRELRLRYGQAMVWVEFQMNGHTEHHEFPLDNLGDNEAFLKLLRNNSIQTIHSQEATLEDIFIEVTGRSLA
jgi:fluoroquinolone transport system ATP-binding protein